MMKAELFLALRYILVHRRSRFISLGSAISMLGLAIGVMSLILVIGVMSGFDEHLERTILGINSHLLIESPRGIHNYGRVCTEVASIPGVEGASPYVSGGGFVLDNDHIWTVLIKGVEPYFSKDTSTIPSYVTKGSFKLKDNQAILGKDLARNIGVNIGDEFWVSTPGGWPYLLIASGVMDTGMYEFDNKLLLVHLPYAQRMLGMDASRISGIALTYKDPYKMDELKTKIIETLGFDYTAYSWIDLNEEFFSALKLEKLAMFIILSLVILVAAFNIIATLSIMVTEKTKDIGILKSIGFSSGAIGRTFSYIGIGIGAIGIFMGTCLGLLLGYLLKEYKFISLPSAVYSIKYLPININRTDVIIILAVAFAISFLATIYPAFKAARLNTVDALRYE